LDFTVAKMFSKKKDPSTDSERPALRGRAAAGVGSSATGRGTDNPLARRFQADREPPTVDLAGPAGFRESPGGEQDPQTTPLQMDASKLGRLISHDSESGKFYIHPGAEAAAVLLQGEPVRAPTELRRGDVIQIGDTEIHFRSAVQV
jgi:hypothetical protein